LCHELIDDIRAGGTSMTTPIKFGYMLDFRNPEFSKLDFATFYAEMFRQIDFIERAGFDSIWLTEHHFVDDGYLAPVMPMLAAIAARTKRLTLGTYVLLAPFYHPLRLAEDAAMIDVLSNGRLRLGIGMGYRDEEFDGLQVSKKTRLSRTLETIEILKRAWTGERFSFAGKHFNFHDVRVLPRPISRPYPELLWGGMTTKAIQRAAELELGFACNLGRYQIDIYREAMRARGKDPANYSLVNSRIVYIADDEKKAWEDIEAAAMYQAGLYGKWLSAATPGQNWIQPDPNQLKAGSIIGSPETVRARLSEVIATAGATELIINTQLPGLAPSKAMRSLERFTSEVLPKLRA
jgi:alkanesulfonate monooxygenase SsuD/methylene tetrahydromethanopterin reductase-like flavin-dependent oxidoreductase (luciferase family)